MVLIEADHEVPKKHVDGVNNTTSPLITSRINRRRTQTQRKKKQLLRHLRRRSDTLKKTKSESVTSLAETRISLN